MRVMVLGKAMSKVSVIIPARKEPYIRETLKDVMFNAGGDIEVILVLDGDIPDYELPNDKRLRVYHNSKVCGLRSSLSAAISVARGKYIVKLDAHCAIGEGWDEILKADCDDNWIVVPRRYWLDAPTWEILKDKPAIDSMVYKYPYRKHRPDQPVLVGRPWRERAKERKDELLLEDMICNGSMFLMHREHYHRIGGMPTNMGYGTFSQESLEMVLKTQLGPWEGKLIRNKNTWYAHWSKPRSHWRGEPEVVGRITRKEYEQSVSWAFYHWWNNRWRDRVHDFDWLVDKFWPLPHWPENWRELESQHSHHISPEPTRSGYKEMNKDTQFQMVMQ